LVIVYRQDSNFGTILELGTLPVDVCPTQICNHSARDCQIGVDNAASLIWPIEVQIDRSFFLT